ncbi:hypothetical protein VTN00DRAFT_493 [Thermoascus crustaceus]|uniref:uncharacterized protein n=1 Tax=Thermoascus crustaceus TaxID=5088 RepID=UPI003743C1FE
MATSAKPEASYASTRLTRRNYNGPPLLSQVGGKKVREDSRYGSSDNNNNDNMEGKEEREPEIKSEKKMKVHEPATDDEPLSSSDESERSNRTASSRSSRGTKRVRPAGKTLEEKLAESDAAAASTAPTEEENDKSEWRNSKKEKAEPRQGSRKSARRSTAAAAAAAEEKPQRQSPKRSLSDILGDDDEEDIFFSLFSSQSSKRRKTIGYGGLKNIHAPPSSSLKAPGSSQSEMLPSPGLKQPRDIPLKEPEAKEEQEESGFKVPREIDIASPASRKSRTRKNKNAKKENDESQPTFKMPPGIDDNDAVHSSQVGGEFKQPPGLPNDSISSSSLATSSAKDQHLFDLDDDSLSSPLSSPTSDLSLELSQEEKALLAAEKAAPPAPPPPSESLCPMCKQPVEPEHLAEFMAQPRRRVRDQHRFCESHRARSAEKEYRERGYPMVDWNKFNDRIRGHFAALEKILEPDYPSSYYRNILDTDLKSGKARNFRLMLSGDGLERISCGYYGTRGASMMLNAVTTRFSKKLRRLAATDNVIKTAGVTIYAQAVLVPELSVLLVKEDMNVNDEDARQILRESIDIGEKVNYAPNDVVPVPPEEKDSVDDDQNGMSV